MSGVTTNGFSYPSPADALTDYPALGQTLANQIDAAIGKDGWIPIVGAFTWASTDGHVFVLNSPDLRTVVPVGSRFKCDQGGTTRYFIVLATAAATITLYGGTDYALTNVATSAAMFSRQKAPLGFPLNPLKWTETLTDSTDRAQASPAGGTWYNPGSQSIAIPIGSWRVSWHTNLGLLAGAGDCQLYAALSTNAGGVSDYELSTYIYGNAAGQHLVLPVQRELHLFQAAKTSWYLTIMTPNAGVGSITFYNSTRPGAAVVRALCAYL